MLKKLKVRRVHISQPNILSSSKNSDATGQLVMTDSVDGCSALPVTQFVRTHMRVDTTWVLCVGASLPHL